MRRSAVAAVCAASFLASVFGLTGCGSSNDEEYVVGNPDNIVLEETPADDGGLEDVPVIDVKVTELPPEWPDTIPVIPNSTIDNVLAMDESITAVWIVPEGDIFDLMDQFNAGLEAGGFMYGQSEASENFGQGEFSNDSHTVEFTITPLADSEWQLYVTYRPLAAE